MRRFGIWLIMAVFTAGFMLLSFSSQAKAAGQNYCVLMKFVNHSRFKQMEPEIKLSDLVMEKLVASGKIRLKETRPLDEQIDTELYDEEYRHSKIIDEAEKGNLDALFDIGQASSLDKAHRGQIISPQITARIGKEHGADFLIQGTITGIARGTVEDNQASVVNNITGILAGKWGGTTGKKVGGVMKDTKKTTTGVNVRTDMRVIKAATGEVIWERTVISASKQDKIKVGDIASVGSDQMNMNLYELALDQAAQRIVDELLADVDKGILQLAS